MHTFLNKLQRQKCQKMADEIRLTCKIDALLYDAFCTCDRELFTPKGFGTHAYKLDALPIQADQWISSPLSVAKMTMALECSNADSVLEIGCGSGYQAYILSRLIRRVFSIERIERLSLEAKGRFKTLGISNIHVRFDDGQNGWREFAPYDRILFSASIAEIPQTLFDQLQDGGILVAPIEKNGTQFITRYKKRGQNISCEELEKCLFVPIKDSKIY